MLVHELGAATLQQLALIVDIVHVLLLFELQLRYLLIIFSSLSIQISLSLGQLLLELCFVLELLLVEFLFLLVQLFSCCLNLLFEGSCLLLELRDLSLQLLL